MHHTDSRAPSRTIFLAAGAAATLFALIALVLAASAPGDSAAVIGKVRGKAPPSCPTPKNPQKKPQKVCVTMATVTGFQMAAHGKKPVMKMPRDGRLVAWSVNLAKPTEEEQASFTTSLKFGPPTAKIAVLKPAKKGKFKLTKQSPKVSLDPLLGTEPIFTLDKALRAKKGTVIALTTGSWIPNLAHGGALTSTGDKWRASRSSGKCGDDPNKSKAENRKDLLEGTPQKKIGTTRRYGCTYTASRLLYQAYYVPTKKKKGK